MAEKLVNVGGKWFPASTKFVMNDGYGEYTITAAQAASHVSSGKYSKDKATSGWSSYEGYIEPKGKAVDPKKWETPKAAPAPSGGGGGKSGGGGGSKSKGGGGGTGNEAIDKMFDKIDQLTGAKANQVLEKDPYGIQKTKLNHLNPERIARSFLTNTGDRGGAGGSYSYNMVVDPATGKAFQNASDAKAAGITNWVYKFQYDAKNGGGAAAGAGAGGQNPDKPIYYEGEGGSGIPGTGGYIPPNGDDKPIYYEGEGGSGIPGTGGYIPKQGDRTFGFGNKPRLSLTGGDSLTNYDGHPYGDDGIMANGNKRINYDGAPYGDDGIMAGGVNYDGAPYGDDGIMAGGINYDGAPYGDDGIMAGGKYPAGYGGIMPYGDDGVMAGGQQKIDDGGVFMGGSRISLTGGNAQVNYDGAPYGDDGIMATTGNKANPKQKIDDGGVYAPGYDPKKKQIIDNGGVFAPGYDPRKKKQIIDNGGVWAKGAGTGGTMNAGRMWRNRYMTNRWYA